MHANRRAVVILSVSAVLAAACNLPTGAGGGRHHQCQQTNYLSDDFSGGTLGNWFSFLGQPVISTTIGDPPPSAKLANANMQSNAAFQNPQECALTFSTAIRLDSGVALVKILIPMVERAATLRVFDTVVVYVLCQHNSCINQRQSVVADTAWHIYEYDNIPNSATTQWKRDGVVQFVVGGASEIFAGLHVNLGVLATDSAGVGPALGYFDNVSVTAK